MLATIGYLVLLKANLPFTDLQPIFHALNEDIRLAFRINIANKVTRNCAKKF